MTPYATYPVLPLSVLGSYLATVMCMVTATVLLTWGLYHRDDEGD